MKRTFWISTGLLAIALVAASFTYTGTAFAKAAAKKKTTSTASATALISQGKALASQYHCNGCHGVDYKGKPGRTPDITTAGALHDYTQAQFVTLLDSGKMNNGRQLTHMPVFHMKAAQSKAIFAYLKTVK